MLDTINVKPFVAREHLVLSMLYSNRRMLRLPVHNIVPVEPDGDFVRKYAPFSKDDLIWIKERYVICDLDWKRADPYKDLELNPNEPWGHVEHMPVADESKRHLFSSAVTMPKLASRMCLLVSDVRLERLSDLTDDKALLEGGEGLYKNYPLYDKCFSQRFVDSLKDAKSPTELANKVWQKTHKRNDDALVWVVEFELILDNVLNVLNRVNRNAKQDPINTLKSFVYQNQ